MRDQAYAQLRDAILDGTLEPGEQLKDAELAEWLGLSRTPIREAVARLEEYGIVETKPNSYTRVAPLSARDARDAFTVYAALEALAASLGVPRLTGADLETMRGRLTGLIKQGSTKAQLAKILEDDYGWRSTGCPQSPPTGGCLQYQQLDALIAELGR